MEPQHGRRRALPGGGGSRLEVRPQWHSRGCSELHQTLPQVRAGPQPRPGPAHDCRCPPQTPGLQCQDTKSTKLPGCPPRGSVRVPAAAGLLRAVARAQARPCIKARSVIENRDPCHRMTWNMQPPPTAARIPVFQPSGLGVPARQRPRRQPFPGTVGEARLETNQPLKGLGGFLQKAQERLHRRGPGLVLPDNCRRADMCPLVR